MSDLSGPVGDTQPADAAVTAKQLAALSNFITSTYRPGMDPELVMRRRVGKVSNEVGEVWEAIEAWTGENFRKGVYGTKDDVIKELLDVACAALCATEHLTGDSGEALLQFMAHVAAMVARAGLELEARHA